MQLIWYSYCYCFLCHTLHRTYTGPIMPCECRSCYNLVSDSMSHSPQPVGKFLKTVEETVCPCEHFLVLALAYKRNLYSFALSGICITVHVSQSFIHCYSPSLASSSRKINTFWPNTMMNSNILAMQDKSRTMP